MDPLRRLNVALEVGSARAYVGERMAKQADKALGRRVEGDELLEWLAANYEPVEGERTDARERLAAFVTIVKADGGFEEMARKIRSDLPQ